MEGVHPPFNVVIVQRKIHESPITNPVIPEVGLFVSAIVTTPEIIVQVPVSEGLGVFAARVPEVVLQRFWSDPAADIVVVESTFIITSSNEGTQPPNAVEIVHLNVAEEPMVRPVTVEFGSLILVTTAVPEITDHVPVSLIRGVLAASVVIVVSHTLISGPADAGVGIESTLIITSSGESGQPRFSLVMVHVSVEEAPTVRPVTVEFGSLILVTMAVPEITDHVPVSLIRGVLAATVPVAVLQRLMSVPASAIVVVESTSIITSLVEATQPPFAVVILHLKVAELPIASPVIPEVGLFDEVINAAPETKAQVPVSVGLGVLAASVAVVILHRS
jgi:hypothetical protein